MQLSSKEVSRRRSNVKDNKNKVINVRFSHDDYLLACERAQQSGLSMSEWIRETATQTPVREVKVTPQINRLAYLDLSASLLEISELLKLIKHGKKLEDLRNGVIERMLVKIVSQIFEVKKRLL